MKDLSEMGGFAAEAIKHDTVSFIAWCLDGRLLTANPQFYLLSGYTAEKAEGLRWPASFTDDELRKRVEKTMEELGRGAKSCQFEGSLVRKDGSVLPVTVFMHMYYPPESNEPVFFAFITDISWLKEQERRLQMTQFAVDHFTDSSIWLDSNGRIQYVNDRACQIMGYSREELLSMSIWTLDPQYTPERYREVWLSVRKGGWAHLESFLYTRDGRKVPMEIHASYIQFDGVERMIAFLRDITERRNAAQALAEGQEKFRVMADTSVAAIFLIQDNRFIYANPAASAVTGYANEEIRAMDFWELIHDEFREGLKKYGNDLLHGVMIPGRFEIKFVRKGGDVGWADLTVAPIRYHGKPAGVITALDITERKRAEEALRESEEKFRVLSELSPSAIFMYQGNKLIYANPAAVAFTGFSMGELLTKNYWEMVHPEYQEMVKMYGQARQKGEPVPTRYEVRYITKAGEERWAEFTAGFIEYRGRPAGIVTAYDMTERKHTEIALQDAKAQAELYLDLMGHDINNMNMAALGFLELAGNKLKSRGSLNSDDLQLITNAMDSLKNSSDLIGSVRKLQKERKGVLKSRYICLDHVLTEVKGRHSNVPGRDITITYSAICDCCVLANELLIDVFSNIMGNAIKHSTGPLAINMSLRKTEENGVIFCRIVIEDTGPGIPDEQKPGIFERVGKEHAKLTGKGLGLYLVKTLVEDFRGKVWIEDRVPGDYNQGSRFVIMLPAAIARDGETGDDEAHVFSV
ncbi:MAG: PAS domain S-box protein [Methanocella sp.]